MYVSLPHGYYTRAVMCEEQSIVLFLIFKSFLFGSIFFFAVIVNVTSCGSCFKSFFVIIFIIRKRDANLFMFFSGNIFDGSWLNDCVIMIIFPSKNFSAII